MTTLRHATLADFARLTDLPDRVRPLWGVVAEEGGEGVGHAFISEIDGLHWAHDLAHHGTDPLTVARMFQRARAWCRANGVRELHTDVRPGSGTERLYRALGWETRRLIMRGEI